MLSTIMFYVYVILWIYSLGEGCTHVAGLLFALEGRPVTEDDVPCTSKPCEWNRPSKKKKDTKPVQDMSFKKISLPGENVKKKKTMNYNVESIKFRNSLCAKLGNPHVLLFFTYFHPVLIIILMFNMILILLILKRWRLVTTFYTFLINI